MRHSQHYKTWENPLVGESVSLQAGTPLLDEKHWSYIRRRYCMSPRELQVAALVCRGLTNEDIAGILKMRPGTVKTHLRSIFSKTRARNKITLLLIFVRDVNEFFRESAPADSLISAIASDKQTEKPPSVGETLKKESI